MSLTEIRAIRPGDNSYLAKIIRNSLEEFGANHPGTVYYDDSTDHLYELFRHPGSVYFVAEYDQQVAGGAGIFPTEGLPEGCVELVKMYLKPEARGQRIGQALISQCLDWAREQGHKQVYLESMPELSKAVSVYEKFGFRYLKGPMGNTGHSGCQIWMLIDL